MLRCLQLARLGTATAPNPMVGAVLVHHDRILGEGYHAFYGGPHAEVNCLQSVKESDRHLITTSTLYVSLEPCAHFGKTPPCADLIIRENIPNVVVGTRDPFAAVAGKGIEKLQRAGITVQTGVLEKECRELNRRFFHFHTMHRPWVVLKWAQTAGGIVAPATQVSTSDRMHISNEATNRIVHQWRSQEMAILIGSGTALKDDPVLNLRYWPGQNPVRLVIDRELTLPDTLRVFNDEAPTIVFNFHQHSLEDGFKNTALQKGKVYFYQIGDDASIVHQVLHALYQLGLTSVLVEGGPSLLQHFIDEQCWDEARVITSGLVSESEGLSAPRLHGHTLQQMSRSTGDLIQYFSSVPVLTPTS